MCGQNSKNICRERTHEMLDEFSQNKWQILIIKELIKEHLFIPDKTPSIIMQQIGDYQNNHLFVLRDDLIPFYLGGNKARKAYFYQENFEKMNVDCVVTYGSVQSNHARTIALMAKAMNIPSFLISPQKFVVKNVTENNNQRLRSLCNMQVINCPITEVKATIEKTMGELAKWYINPYFIPGGGHDLVGICAIVDLMFKIDAWETEHDIIFDRIFFASGTGGTQAGLILGDVIADYAEKAHNKSNAVDNSINRVLHNLSGISIARKAENGIKPIKEAMNIFAEYFNLDLSSLIIMSEMNNDINYVIDIGSDFEINSMIDFNTKYILGGYAKYNTEIKNLIIKMLQAYQLPLDPNYTGKAFWGLTKELERIKGENVLFIHTGGTPLFYDFLQTNIID